MTGQPGVAAGEPAASPDSTYAVISPGRIEWAYGVRAAALAVLIAAIPLSLLVGAPLGLSMLVAGFVSVMIYRRRFPYPLTAKMGVQLGAASGAIAFIILVIGVAATEKSLHGWAHAQQWIVNRIQQSASGSPPDQVQLLVDFFNSPAGMAIAVAMLFVGFLIFSGVGGALGALLLRRRQHL